MQTQLPRHDFETWLQGTKLLSLEGKVVTIGTPTPFHKEGLEHSCIAPLRRSLGDVVGFPVEVRVVVAPPQEPARGRRGSIAASGEHKKSSPPPAAEAPTDGSAGERAKNNGQAHSEPPPPDKRSKASKRQSSPSTTQSSGGSTAHNGAAGQDESAKQIDFLSDPVQLDLTSAIRSGILDQRYTFSRFIVGPSNRLAHAACIAVADAPSRAYNPLFIYGGVGLGKTHLLHAIGNSILDRDSSMSILYVSAEKFTNDLINAIRRQQAEEFRARYRNIDVLLIDDIQFIAGKDRTQEEFFHTFNALHPYAKQIVISSDRPPKAIMMLEERLRSRFEWGLIADVQPPDLETRMAILRAKGEQKGLNLPNDVVDYLAYKVQRNIRELEGCLTRIEAYIKLHNVPVTVDLAAAVLNDLLEDAHERSISAETVLETICTYYAITMKNIRGRSRSRTVVVPRQVAMYLLREEAGCSLATIGALLGGRDHSTVLHGYEKIADELTRETRIRNDITAIRDTLHQRHAAFS
jgi:chromosomal replication initiator protein